MPERGATRLKTVERPLEQNLIDTAGANMMDRFRQDLRTIGRELEEFETRIGTALWTPIPRPTPSLLERVDVAGPMDLEDQGTEYLVHVDVPGIKKDELLIRFLDQSLEIKAETEKIRESEQRNYVYHERSSTGIQRRVNFPTPILPEKAEATLEHGVLTVIVPKQKPAKETRIRIE